DLVRGGVVQDPPGLEEDDSAAFEAGVGERSGNDPEVGGGVVDEDVVRVAVDPGLPVSGDRDDQVDVTFDVAACEGECGARPVDRGGDRVGARLVVDEWPERDLGRHLRGRVVVRWRAGGDCEGGGDQDGDQQ